MRRPALYLLSWYKRGRRRCRRVASFAVLLVQKYIILTRWKARLGACGRLQWEGACALLVLLVQKYKY